MEKEKLINDLLTLTDDEWEELFRALDLISPLNLVNESLN